MQAVDLLGALLLGIGAGLGGRGFAWLVRRAKGLGKHLPALRRLLIGGLTMAALAVASHEAFGESLTLGPGTDSMAWVVDDRTLSLIALLFVLRVATAATLVAGGVGGLFIPLATLGVVMGEFVGEALGEGETILYPILGPPPSSVPATGRRSPRSCSLPNRQAAWVPSSCLRWSPLQSRSSSPGRRRLLITSISTASAISSGASPPLSSILSTDVLTVPPGATVSEFVYFHVLARRERVVPVVDGGTYVGMARLDDISELDRDEWENLTIAGHGDRLATARPSWTRDAVVAMETSDTDKSP